MRLFGPPRSKFGKWIDSRGISQSKIVRESGVHAATVSDLVNGKTKKPSRLTVRKLMRAIKEIDPSISPGDFWDV